MTFYEAAVAVLLEAGRPLNVKKILELAMKRDLLSHVGKHPENALADRLAQETKKSPDETLIREVRPGVYGLKEGADIEAARETIRPRAPKLPPAPVAAEPVDEAATAPADDAAADPTPEDAAPVDDADDAEGDADDASDDGATDEAASAEGDDADENGDDSGDGGDGGDARRDRSRRRRGKRGGRNRRRDEEGAPADDARDAGSDAAPPAPAAPVADAPAPAPTPRRNAAQAPLVVSAPDAREVAAARPAAATPTPSTAVNGHGLGDLARAVASILEGAGERGMTLRGITNELAQRGVGSLGRLGGSVLRAELEHTNDLRARLGRPPLFEEIRPNIFTLAVASGSELATSYASLDAWQDEHRRILRATLLDRVRDLSDDALGSVVTLLLDRMGYRDLKSHSPDTDELVTISALAPRGLTSARTAIRVLRPRTPIARKHVIALRGSLHSYHATEGAILSLSGVEDAATSEANVPNLASITLIGPAALTDHLASHGVGVQSFTVDVSCIDEGLFRELPNSQG